MLDFLFFFFFSSRNVKSGRTQLIHFFFSILNNQGKGEGVSQLIHANSVCFSSSRRCRSMLGRHRDGLALKKGVCDDKLTPLLYFMQNMVR